MRGSDWIIKPYARASETGSKGRQPFATHLFFSAELRKRLFFWGLRLLYPGARKPLRERVGFYVLYGLFWLNEQMTRRLAWRDWCWAAMRFRLFEITGACQHSGNCCRSLMLVQEGRAVDTPEAYTALIKNTPVYSRFLPVLGTTHDGASRIHRFRCHCLTGDNRCNDYANRPRICHQYPMSMFIKLGYIHAGCGYKVQLRGFYPYVRHPVFWSLVFQAMRENRLSHESLQSLRG